MYTYIRNRSSKILSIPKEKKITPGGLALSTFFSLSKNSNLDKINHFI